MILTDESPMPWGQKYRGTKMANVPADYLNWAYDFITENHINSFSARDLLIYIDETRDVIDKDLRETEDEKDYGYLND